MASRVRPESVAQSYAVGARDTVGAEDVDGLELGLDEGTRDKVGAVDVITNGALLGAKDATTVGDGVGADVDSVGDVVGLNVDSVGDVVGVDVDSVGDVVGLDVDSVGPSSQFDDDFEAFDDLEALDDFVLHFVDFGAFEDDDPLAPLVFTICITSTRGAMKLSSNEVNSTGGVILPLSFLVVLWTASLSTADAKC